MRTKNTRLIFPLIIISLSLIGLLATVLAYANIGKISAIKFYNKPTDSKYHDSYPSNKDFFETAYKFTKDEDIGNKNYVVAGIIPHHLLAADLIANFFNNLEGADFDIVVLIGPNHFSSGQADIISSAYDWRTPYGILSYDKKVGQLLNKKSNIVIDEQAVEGEHAIFSEVSFIKKTFPQAKFVPLMMRSTVDSNTVTKLAKSLFAISKDKKILVLASVDFSHYKTSQEAQADDKESIAAIDNFDFNNIYNINVDSPPAIYTILKFADLNNTKFNLLDNSNSAILSNHPELESTTSYITGYFLPSQFLKNNKNQETNLMFVGDVMLSRSVGEVMLKKNDWAWPFLNIADYTSKADILFGNLEGPISDRGHDMGSPYSFRADPRVVTGLKLAGFDVMSVANNHIADWGREAMADTINILEQNNILVAGGGENINQAHYPKIIEKNNIKFAFLAYTPFANKFSEASQDSFGITDFDKEIIASDIKTAKTLADVVIVSFHFGEEYQTMANSFQVSLAHLAVDNGADLVIGHHPHVVQNLEKYKDSYIAYSLGNFVFDQTFSKDTMTGEILKVIFSGKNILSVDEVPINISMSLQANLSK